MIKSITQYVEQYLYQRQYLGTALSSSAVRELHNFASFADDRGAKTVTSNLFLDWKQHYGSASTQSWAGRLSHVRTFARWLQSIDPNTEVMPMGLVPRHRRRPQPYIYTDEQIAQIVNRTMQLESPSGLRGVSYATLFGLIAATGLRISEALGLDDSDVDTEAGVLQFRSAKNTCSRVIAVSPSTAARLAEYRSFRDRFSDSCKDAAFSLARTDGAYRSILRSTTLLLLDSTSGCESRRKVVERAAARASMT